LRPALELLSWTDMNTSLLSGTGVAIAGALLLLSCGGGGSSTASPPAAPTPTPTPTPSTVTVSIVSSVGNGAYKPNPVMANSGDTVVFRNNDATMHHVVLDDGSADLGDVMPGATSKGLTLKNAGAARFHCTIHSSMVGTINESTAPPTPPCPDPYGYGC
jgi:plastocyanin